ncbi:hypothetical protein [Microseira sp. BLCC-F43]|jgi:hypothetical protein|uniref:hypothetical protein n=1 Tax=Microseira sp. BLCC-F43 TaxID=3153602 RepID=UPI0035B98E5B
MSTYNQILDEVKSLTLTDQQRLLEELKKIVDRGVEVEGDDEVIPAEEIAQSEAAWEDYLALRDRGISSKELKSKLYAIEIQGEAIVLRPVTSVPLWQKTTPAERVNQWQTWATKHQVNPKALPDEALHRDSIYD